jgi:hypothetical protein
MRFELRAVLALWAERTRPTRADPGPGLVFPAPPRVARTFDDPMPFERRGGVEDSVRARRGAALAYIDRA